MVLDTTSALHRRARYAAWACRIAAGAIPAAILASWVLGDAAGVAIAHLRLPPAHPLSALQRVVATVLSLLPALALALSLRRVAVCFDAFAVGDWFGAAQPRALRDAGRWLALSGALSMAVPTLLGLVLSANAAPGARVLAVTLSSNAVLGLLFGTLIWTLGHLWTVAHAIADENARFV